MVRQLENGPELNNKVQIIGVAVFSFLLGIVGMSYYQKAASDNEYRDAKLLAAKRAERLRQKEVTTIPDPASKPDYYSFRKQLYAFQETLRHEVTQKFAEGNLKDESSEGRRNILNSKVALYFKNKDPWFKATLNLDKDNKIVIYYNFLTSKESDQVQKSVNVSFTAYLYIYNNGKWSNDLSPTGLSQLVWNNDEPYFPINLSHNMEGFARNTDYLLIMIPIPSDSGVLHFLKYQDSKMTWKEGPKVTWSLSSKEEAWGFQKAIYKVIEQTPYYLQP